jgi:thiamine biosynthesis lipoprotein
MKTLLRPPLPAVIAFVLLSFSPTACAPARFSEGRIVMSSPFQVIVYTPVQPSWEDIFAYAKKTADLFDHRIKDSPLERLNRTGSGVLPEPAFSALKEALLIADKSGGAFDPTVLPLMERWDFEGAGRVPDKAEIADDLRKTGYRKVKIEGVDRVVLSSGAQLDLGGIGEGAVVDAVASHLDSLGYADYLVDASGEIVAAGSKPGGVPWSVAIRSPRRAGMPRTSPAYSPELLGVLGRIELDPKAGKTAVSTSGDYEKFFVKNGVAYTHIIDPRTGYPAAGAVSVTVLAPTCAEADALATTAFVLGFEKGLRFLEDWPGVEGLVVREKDGQLEMKTTSGFPKLIPVEN